MRDAAIAAYTREEIVAQCNAQQLTIPQIVDIVLTAALRDAAATKAAKPTNALTPAQALDFTAFWNSYPRKIGIRAARGAWAVAMTEGAVPEDIIAGALRYAKDPALPKDPGFIPHPATWLAAGRWLDAPDSPARTGVADGFTDHWRSGGDFGMPRNDLT